ncbi:Alpha/Beta hydrolase protein [Dichotomocladium elegans]|nr:Alpha/Beta hydrolase protein [Dichotomocladium elegans]
MLALITAFTATAYVLSVFSFGLFTTFTFNKQLTHDYVMKSLYLRKFLIVIGIFTSMIAEIPLHLLVLKLLGVVVASLFGAFRYKLSYAAYLIDIANMIALVMLFIESLGEKEVVEEAIKDLTGGEPADPIESILSLAYIKRLILFFWTPEDLIMYPNITYATNEESAEAIALTKDYEQPRKMALDIYKCAKAPKESGLRPVLVHIHGGAWRMGTKNHLYPHEKMLLTEDNWLVVNIGYRLAPKNPYPTHLIDIKRALRWIKKTISTFGGDPNFIVLSGDSAGGHLAAMTILTTNDPQYQPGFEDVDTSVNGLISLNGALDIANDQTRAAFFSMRVAMKDKVDTDFLLSHSPVDLLHRTSKELLLPSLIIAGDRDLIVDSSAGIRYKSTYDEVAGKIASQCVLLRLPTAHHVFHISWSARAYYSSRMIQIWSRDLYAKKK